MKAITHAVNMISNRKRQVREKHLNRETELNLNLSDIRIDLHVLGILIYGGDWNAQLDPTLDSTNIIKILNSESIYVKKMLKEMDMVDIVRELNPSRKRFTIFKL